MQPDEVLAPALRSLVFSVLATAIAVVPALPLAVKLGMSRSPATRWGLVAARAGMAFPTVAVGLLVYAMLSRYGPLGGLDLLYTPWAIITGEVLLAVPMIIALGAASVGDLDPRFRETVQALGLRGWTRIRLACGEAREGLLAAVLAAFARCVTELGVALLVGGNLQSSDAWRSTRTLTTSIATETSRGDFRAAMARGLLLIGVALAVNLAVDAIRRRKPR
ncbi:MAG: Tungstate uptake system permease protein TupB [Planctomycetes bacterium]|nr:Tungstate uptake system permease protein TupB [Planctomycetota bacterium]